jgi:polysaccharide pyruvyl transferase CsaB
LALKHYLLVGYYGYGNAGDERLLSKTVALIKTRYPKALISILAPRKSVAFSVSANCVSRWNPFSVLSAIRKSSALIFGGGSLFQTRSSKRSLLYYLAILKMGQFLGKKTVLLSHGFEKLEGRITNRWASSAFKKADHISTRDEASYDLLTKLGVPENHIVLASDLAYYKEVMPANQTPVAQENVAISLREHPLTDTLIEGLTLELDTIKNSISYISCQKAVDMPIIESFNKSSLPIKDTLLLETLMNTTEQAQTQPNVVISMRYHTCVWASLNQIPFIAIDIDPKLRSLALELEQGILPLRNEIQIQRDLKRLLDSLRNNANQYTHSLRSHTKTLIERALLNDRILEYL